MSLTTITAAERCFRAMPRKVQFRNGVLEIAFIHTTYSISRWPDWSLSYSTGNATAKPLISRVARYALFNCLETLRTAVTTRPDHRLAVYELLRELPTPAHARLVRMESRYWLGVDFLAAYPAAMGLLDSAPGLFAATAVFWHEGHFRQTEKNALEALLLGRQRLLAAHLGLGDSEAACKVLRKFVGYDLSADQWRCVAENLCLPDVLLPLQHVPAVTSLAVAFLAKDDPVGMWCPRIKGDYLAKVVERSQCEKFWGIDIYGLSEVGGLLKRYGLLRDTGGSVDQLIQSINRGMILLDEASLTIGPEVKCPGVCPITTPRELRAEGEQMRHCVGDWSHQVAALKGEACYYRMSGATRATISLRRAFLSHEWIWDQIKGVQNAHIQADLLTKIKQAFRQTGVITDMSS